MILSSKDALENVDFLEGVTLLVDKPLEWTSFDVVNKIRFSLKKKLSVKKIKVGHAGTLDPLATGLLIIAIGKDTKKIDHYQGQVKKYSGTLRLGATTVSYDSEFEPDQQFETGHITTDLIEEKRKTFIGAIEQYPPAFSALKVQGQRAYKLARKGIQPELKSRIINIYDFTLEQKQFPDLEFNVTCEKGTYIRSLAHDFGKSLDSGAYLIQLRREAIGDFNVKDAFILDELIELLA
jgi:tRNA pseudouridine55 synthase